MKDAYKSAKDNNKLTGASPIYSPFYDDFDEILSCRDVVNMPNISEVGAVSPVKTKEYNEKTEKPSTSCEGLFTSFLTVEERFSLSFH